MNRKNKRVLIAGGAGFVGSHLCCQLVDKGYNVICIDNLSTGRIKNIANIMKCPLIPQHYNLTLFISS